MIEAHSQILGHSRVRGGPDRSKTFGMGRLREAASRRAGRKIGRPPQNIARSRSDLDGIACALATSAALCFRLASKLAVRLKNWVNGDDARCEGDDAEATRIYSNHRRRRLTRVQPSLDRASDRGRSGCAEEKRSLTKADKLAPPRLGTPVPRPGAQKKTGTDTEFDAEQAALVKVMKAAIAARHGGVLPKTVSDEDTRVASQAAAKWQAKQAAER